MTGAVLAGAGFGLGLVLMLAALTPRRVSLSAQLAELDAAAQTRHQPAPPAGARLARARWLASETLARAADDRGWWGSQTQADLALCGLTRGEFVARRLGWAAVGLCSLPLLALTLAAVAVSLPIVIPTLGALALAAAGFAAPAWSLRRAAAVHRRALRTVVGSYLDLVAMRMSAGSGLDEALTQAAGVGHGWGFARLRAVLADARTDGLTPAAALGRLGQNVGLPDLVDTSQRLQLVDTTGAQAETSLRAQAASIRDRELAELHGSANERSESMLVAQVLLAMAFLLFLGYPALATVLSF